MDDPVVIIDGELETSWRAHYRRWSWMKWVGAIVSVVVLAAGGLLVWAYTLEPSRDPGARAGVFAVLADGPGQVMAVADERCVYERIAELGDRVEAGVRADRPELVDGWDDGMRVLNVLYALPGHAALDAGRFGGGGPGVLDMDSLSVRVRSRFSLATQMDFDRRLELALLVHDRLIADGELVAILDDVVESGRMVVRFGLKHGYLHREQPRFSDRIDLALICAFEARRALLDGDRKGSLRWCERGFAVVEAQIMSAERGERILGVSGLSRLIEAFHVLIVDERADPAYLARLGELAVGRGRTEAERARAREVQRALNEYWISERFSGQGIGVHSMFEFERLLGDPLGVESTGWGRIMNVVGLVGARAGRVREALDASIEDFEAYVGASYGEHVAAGERLRSRLALLDGFFDPESWLKVAESDRLLRASGEVQRIGLVTSTALERYRRDFGDYPMELGVLVEEEYVESLAIAPTSARDVLAYRHVAGADGSAGTYRLAPRGTIGWRGGRGARLDEATAEWFDLRAMNYVEGVGRWARE